MADPDPAAETPRTRVDSGRGQPTADAPARWSAAAAVPPRTPGRRWWRRRPAGPDTVEHTAVDPDDWAWIPAVDPWAGMDTEWDSLITEVPLPATAVEPPAAAPPPTPPTRTEPACAAAPPPTPPTRSEPAAPLPTPPTRTEPAVAAAAVPPREPKVTWRERLARNREPLEREVRERAARQGEVLQRVAQQQATRVRESMAKAAKTAPPLVSRVPVQPRPPAGPPPRPPMAAQRPPSPPWPGQPRPGPFPPAPARRPRRRPRRLLLFVLLLMVGVPLVYEQVPAARQYPVSADLPDSFSDLTRRDDKASRQAAERLATQLNAVGVESDDVFAGVYGDGRGKRVTVFGVTGWRFTPGSDAQAEIDKLAADFGISTVTSYETGESGVHELCATGRASGAAVVVCAWADHGSLAAVVLTRRSEEESADLVGRLRSAVLTRG